MERRIIAIQKMKRAFVQVVSSVRMSNQLNFTDINIVAEDFFKTLFNILYNYDLENANAFRQNETAIDLFYNTERIAYQITSQNKPAKILKSVSDFVKTGKHNSYSKFTIFSITDGKKCKHDALQKLDEYNVEGYYINVSDLERQIMNMETEKLEIIAGYLEFETNPYLKEKPFNKIKVDEELKSLHIVDQISTVLNYFEGFSLIYPRTLSKIYPFNIEEKTFDSYSNYCLKTNNKTIHDLLKKININENKEIEISDELLRPYIDKLKEIFIRLNNSLVSCICYREKYIEIQHHNIQMTEPDTNCSCKNCQYQKFDTQTLFNILKERYIEHSNNLTEALNEGYYLCKLGEHIRGWQVFNSVAKKSKQENKSIIHFIAQHNNLAIYNFVDSPWWHNEAKAILPKIKEIDLHNLLCNLNVHHIIRDELIKLKEDYHLHYSREKIDEYAERIKSTKILYAKKGFSSSTDTVGLLIQEMHLLYAFYALNSIITDDFFTFRAAMTKGIEAVFVSYTTENRFAYKYKEFDNFILSMMLFYVEENSLRNIFEKCSVLQIKIRDAEKQAFLKLVINFFTSQFVSTWDNPKQYDDFGKQDYFSHYRQLLRHLLNRLMLILTKVNLTSEELSSIAQPFTDFLHVSQDLHRSSWEFIVEFLDIHIRIFNEQQIKSIIELSVSDKNHRSGDNLLQDICGIVTSKTNFLITNHSFFLKLFNIIILPCPTCNRIHDETQMCALWKIANESGKLLIKEKALRSLEEKFDADFYQRGAFLGIFNKDEHQNLLEQYIIYAQNNCRKSDLKEEKGRWIVQDYTGFNCIVCLDYMDVDFKTAGIQAIANKSDYYYWLINYENYDYSEFNFKWLIDACPHHLKVKLRKVNSLRKAVVKQLLLNYDKELAFFYTKHLLK